MALYGLLWAFLGCCGRLCGVSIMGKLCGRFTGFMGSRDGNKKARIATGCMLLDDVECLPVLALPVIPMQGRDFACGGCK